MDYYSTWSDSLGKQNAVMLVSFWSKRIKDVDTMPRKWVTTFNILQIELIELLCKSYDGTVLNLGMKPGFLTINSFFFFFPDHAV